MRNIYLKEGSNGSFGEIKIVETKDEKENITYYKEYENDIQLLGDLRKYVIDEGFVYSCYKKDNKIVLKKDAETEIVLVDFTNEVLLNLINKKIISSFELAIDIFQKYKYYYVNLTASYNRTNFDLINSSPNKRNQSTVFIEFELDEEGKLSSLGEAMLKIFKEKELVNWFRVFLSKQENNSMKVCYDEKTMTINRVLTDYIKDEVNKQQELYLQINEKTKEKRGK